MRDRYRCSLTSLLLLTSGMLLASCSSSPGSGSVAPQFNTPLHAVYAWFTAINDKQESVLVAHAAPGARDMMNWNGGITSMWPSFQHVKCKVTNATHSTSNLLCTFNESAPPGNQIDTFWTVSMTQSATGRWLITNYGQG